VLLVLRRERHGLPTKARSGRSRRDFPRRREAQGSWPRAQRATNICIAAFCLNEANAVSEVSYAAGHETEHRRAVLGEAEDRLGLARRGLTGRAFAARTPKGGYWTERAGGVFAQPSTASLWAR
jgi:hypothetical protein